MVTSRLDFASQGFIYLVNGRDEGLARRRNVAHFIHRASQKRAQPHNSLCMLHCTSFCIFSVVAKPLELDGVFSRTLCAEI